MLTVSADNNNLTTLVGKGDGTFTAGMPVATGSSPNSVVSSDFNGDGFADAATANFGSDSISVVLGKGDGSYQTTATPSAGAALFSVAASDLNGDGKPDLAVISRTLGRLHILLNNAQ